MKTKHLIWLLLIVTVFESCMRAMTPYEAANNPRGKKCRNIR